MAKRLRGRKYDKCSYFGYQGEITMGYVPLDPTSKEMKEAYKGPVEDAGTHRWMTDPKTMTIFGRAGRHRDPF